MLDLLQSEHFRQAIASPVVMVSAAAALSTCFVVVQEWICCALDALLLCRQLISCYGERCCWTSILRCVPQLAMQ
jgi:hypothetical protein